MPTFLGQIVDWQMILAAHVSDAGSPINQQTPAFGALIDTGAQGSAISQKVVDALSLKPSGWTTIMGVHGSEDAQVYTVSIGIPITEDVVDINGASMAHTITRSKNRIEASLMGFQDPKFDVLLGMDVLSGFHLNIYGDQFILSN